MLATAPTASVAVSRENLRADRRIPYLLGSDVPPEFRARTAEAGRPESRPSTVAGALNVTSTLFPARRGVKSRLRVL
jgi:hypothetical protein